MLMAEGGGLIQERGDIPAGLWFHAWLLQEAEIAEPVDESILPGSEWRVVAVGQASGHVAAVGQGVSRMTAVAVNVHLDIRDGLRQHGAEIFHRPNGMNAVSRTATYDECRRNVARDRRRSTIVSKRRWPRINNAHKIGPRSDSRERIAGTPVFLIEIRKLDGGRGG